MFKQTLAIVALSSFINVGAALAEDKATIAPGKGDGPTDAMSEQTPTMKPDAAKANPAAIAAPEAAAAAPCTQADLAALITKAGGLTDKDKQKMAMGHLDLAQKSLNQKDMTACAMHMKEAQANLGTVTK
jgi:hypothetical protein